MRFPLVLFACALALSGSSTPSVVVLEKNCAPLIEHFNSQSDHLRFVAILSPT